ncbi:MAG: tRNA pseudouridine(13) synthase TruD [Chloroflexi bacterium]|nr:tRNA pseudouridine(13) synthase TruD [Chloroflexota bacterium]
MRIKASPEDFIVEEAIRLTPVETGPFALYRVHKRGVTTTQALESIAAQLHVGKRLIVFPALKDKAAATIQYASVKGAAPPLVEGNGFRAERVGYAERALRPADLRGNRFTIVARDLSLEEAQRLGPRLRQMAEFGLPNYFDDQRFGSYSGEAGFIGKKILQRDAEGALKVYLAQRMVGDPERVRVFKEFALGHWGEWGSMMEHAPKPSNFRSVLTYLKDHPADFRRALNLIPPPLLSLYLSAYQSWLWNLIAARCTDAALAQAGFKTRPIRVAGGDLPVYFNLPDGLRLQLDRLMIPLPNHRAAFAEPLVEQAAAAVLAQEQLTLNDFKARILKRAFADKSSRALIVRPQEVSASDPDNDELARKRWKVTVRFFLPPGSYATLVMKAI